MTGFELRKLVRRGILAAGAGVSCVALASAQAVKISAPMNPIGSGDVTEAALAPDGVTLVWLADHVVAGAKELYARPLDGSAPARRLTDFYGTGATISPQIELTGDRAFFRVNVPLVVQNRFLPYAVLLDGSAPPVRLSEEPCTLFEGSPDGTRMAFAAANRLWIAPADGSLPALELAQLPSSDLAQLSFTPDGSRLVYLRAQLFSVAADGSEPPVTIGPVLTGTERVAPASGIYPGPTITPDGRFVVYHLRTAEFGERHRFFRSPVDGSAPALELAGTDFPIEDFRPTPDGRAVIVRSRIGFSTPSELYRFTLENGARARLSAPGSGSVSAFRIAADGSAVVYSRAGSLHVARLDRRQAAPPSARVLTRASFDFRLTPDGRRVLYVTGPHGAREIWSRHVSGREPPVLLSGGITSLNHVTELFSPDGARVLVQGFEASRNDSWIVPVDGSTPPVLLTGAFDEPFLPVALGDEHAAVLAVESATETRSDATELFRVTPAGGPPLRLNEPLALEYGDVDAIAWTPAGDRAVWVADHDAYSRLELYGAPTDGSQPATLLSDFTLPTGMVSDFHVGPDGQYVFYVANGEENPGFPAQTLLYRVRTDGSAAPDRLVERSVLQVATPVQVSPDGGTIAYCSTESGSVGLWAVPTDGSRAHVPLSVAWVRNDFRITADGARVVFRRGASQGSAVNGLYSVPLAGGAAPVPLASDATGFTLAPDGQRAIYNDSAGTLFAVKVDGSEAPIGLNGGLGGVHHTYRVGGLSEYAVFVASFQLASARLDGSSGPIALSAAVPNAGVGLDYALGSGAVLYTALRPTGENADLYAVSVDGTLGPGVLSGPWPGGNYHFPVAVSESPQRAVYLADQDVDERYELYSVRFNATDRVRLNPALDAGRDVTDFQLAGDGTVLYLSDQELDGVVELFAVPVTGCASVRLNGPQALGGDVTTYAAIPGRRVLYKADAEIDGVVELWSTSY